jgi:DNA-binding NarL/FixJ family response regulator
VPALEDEVYVERPIGIVIADDHPVVRYGLRHLLDGESDIRVLAEAATAREALAQVASTTPDVVLLDLELGDAHGVEALRRMRTHAPDVAVIVHTAFNGDQRLLEAVELGIRGYLLKSSDMDYVPRAIRVVHSGETFFEPAVAAKLLRYMRHHPLQSGRDRELTERERQVVALLAKGATNRDIAAALFVSERTVKFHVSAVLQKLGARNRTEAWLIATSRGFVDLV